MERVRTPIPAIRLGIHLHLAGLSLSNTVSVLESFDIDRSRKAVHDWVKQADLQPEEGREAAIVALDETVVKIDGDEYWLFGAVDAESGDILHVGVYPHRTMMATQLFLREVREKHYVDDDTFLVDGAPWLHAALERLGLTFQHVTHGLRNRIERVFQEIKRRVNQLYNNFPNAEPESVESWLQALAIAQNQLK